MELALETHAFTWLITGFALVFGLVIGSFLNVVIWRLPREESVVHPPSRCPQCGNGIKWYDNIPVLSWLMLRAKCRNCKHPIPARYAIVESLTGTLFATVAWHITNSASTAGELLALLPYLYITAIGVALAFIDLDTHKLPNKIILPAYPIAATLVIVASFGAGWDWATIGRAALGGLALYGFYFILCIIGGMGFGDVKLAGVLGLSLAWLGWDHLIIGGFLPFVLGGLYSGVLILLRRAGRKSGIPFGPWMLLGWFLALFISEPLANWYLSIVFAG